MLDVQRRLEGLLQPKKHPSLAEVSEAMKQAQRDALLARFHAR
jgi:hypothetical protein